ncbi:MAG: sigma-70 family RNA polymerase sigma factor [Lachnospiraceae bacterium]|nr:sigma-70 family RNA polymerase sigma factor [Lachnospiraceae bacterium]
MTIRQIKHLSAIQRLWRFFVRHEPDIPDHRARQGWERRQTSRCVSAKRVVKHTDGWGKRRWVGERCKAQDECFDDVFLAVWNYIESFDESRNEFKSWVAAIARNQAIDYLRKYKRQLEELSYEEEIEGRAEEILILELEKEISEETEKMLACLTERDQELMKRIF